ncbi:MAG: septum site-determining protein MinC [Gammaproteobacteria bacterium]
MPATTQPTSDPRPVIEFKSSSITLPALLIASNDLLLIAEHLHQKVQQAPDFFKNTAVLLDLHDINKQQLDVDLAALLATISAAGLITAGIRGGNDKHNETALAHRIAVFAEPRGGATAASKASAKAPLLVPEDTDAAPAGNQTPNGGAGAETKMITQPIRSGQRVYAGGDLIVLAPVSAGAEIMAEGNIHVYSTLRGRALAGVQGNTQSRIFCSDLQAELISIAGHYRVSEDLKDDVRGKQVQIFLQEHALLIHDL